MCIFTLSRPLIVHLWRSGGGLGFGGLGIGGGCGVGVGLGWGWGAAYGAHYIVVNPEFAKTKPAWKQKLDDATSKLPFPFPGKPEPNKVGDA
jgi:hypothetical protein